MQLPPWTGIYLLLIWILPYGSVRFFLAYQEIQIEKRVSQQIYALTSESSLFFFKIARKDSAQLLSWEHEHEFSYQNQMFDVVRKEIRKDSLHLWCLWDVSESKLKKIESEGTVGRPDGNTSGKTHFLAWTLSQLLVLPDKHHLPIIPPLYLQSSGYWSYNDTKGTELKAQHFQPPERV